MLDEARVRAEEKEKLLDELKNSRPSELSDKFKTPVIFDKNMPANSLFSYDEKSKIR